VSSPLSIVEQEASVSFGRARGRRLSVAVNMAAPGASNAIEATS